MTPIATHPAVDALWRAQLAAIAAGYAESRRSIVVDEERRRAQYVARAAESAGLLAGIREGGAS